MKEKDLKLQSENENGTENGVENGTDIEAKEWKTDHGLVRQRVLETEMEESYLDYAMSVIVSRALPDVRDGLKPVHRKILFSMNELGLTAGAKFRKSATVVGDVMGKYHPHGDVAIYDSLARMAQDFNMRYTLIKGQGNFGSIDGDMPAAMRYTECKLEKISESMISDIDKDTVDFMDNFDASRREPKVLPTRIPNLLVNGAMGIAVGMATDIPPHNLTEVCNATIQLIENPNITIDELVEFIKGPDFPTGGEIYDIEEIKLAYATGKGRVVMRGVAVIEEGKKNAERIRISQIPYRVNKATLIEKVAQLVKDKRIQGISDIRDESDKEGIRVVIDLKRDSHPQKILNQLYKFTQLQEAFHVNMLALVDGIKPQVLNLKTILEEFLKHRQQVVYRRTQFDLKQAEDRLHILEGLKQALGHIDAVIATIKKSKNRIDAEQKLIKQFKLSKIQVNAILEMRLSSLARLERDKIEKEYNELVKKIKEYKAVLADPKKVLKIIKDELDEVKEKYGDERKTKLFKRGIGELSQEDLIPNERVFVSLTKGNYIKRVSNTAYRSQARGGKGVIGITTKEEDLVVQMLVANNHDDVLFFTNRGRVFSIKAYEIAQSSRQSKGQAIVNLLQISSDEKITSMINISSKENQKFLIMATDSGLIKKTSLTQYQNIRKSGLIAIKLKKGNELHWVKATSGEDQIIIVTKNGQAIRFSEKNCRPMGRAAAGVRGIRLRTEDVIVGMEVISHKNVVATQTIEDFVTEKMGASSDLLVVTEKGLGKRTPIKNYNIQMRGGVGLRTSRITEKTGPIIESRLVSGNIADLVLISEKGQVIRLPIKQVKQLGRATSGVRLMRLNAGDKIASVTVIEKEKEENLNQKEEIKNKNDKLKLKSKTNKSKAKKSVTKSSKLKKPAKRSKILFFAKTTKEKTKKSVKKIRKIIVRAKPAPFRRSRFSGSKTKKAIKPVQQKEQTEAFKKKTVDNLIKTSDQPIFIKKQISDDSDQSKLPPKSDTNYWGADFWKKKKL